MIGFGFLRPFYPTEPILPVLPRWIALSTWILPAIAYAFPKNKLLRIAICLYFAYLVLISPLHREKKPGAQYVEKMELAAIFLRCSTLFWLTKENSPYQNVTSLETSSTKTAKSEQINLSLSSRLRYGWCLHIAFRGVGFNGLEVKNLPAKQLNISRFKFVLQSILKAVWYIVAYDVIDNYYRYAVQLDVKPPGHLSQIHWIWTIIDASFMMYVYVCSMSGAYNILAAISVGTGITPPSSWPALFGTVSRAYTVNRFWSNTWHQIHRIWFMQIAECVVRDILRIRRGTFLSRTATIFVVFFASWTFHGWGAFTSLRRGSGEFRFFMSQAVAILTEERLAELWKLSGFKEDSSVWRACGYLWTWAFLWWSWGAWKENLDTTGSLRSVPLDSSLVGYALKTYGFI